ncbi:jg8449 [Pararge aegeria aegeria]|uniref:Jg8449 protein n=1 Tax=Pararge aegeria aegeria TaxID=348720 RepID=A0A8S4S6E7_9NEOP|nr:jg8449 [Pararge aegeria aegeria]
MDSNSVSPMPELAPIAEFDKSPPSPPNEEVPMDDLPPPPVTISQAEGKKLKVVWINMIRSLKNWSYRHSSESNVWVSRSWNTGKRNVGHPRRAGPSYESLIVAGNKRPRTGFWKS